MTTIEQLKEYMHKMDVLAHATTLLYWDASTCMPEGGFEENTEAQTLLSMENFKLSKSPEFEKMLYDLYSPESYEKLNDAWKFIIKRMIRDIEEQKRIPDDFYEEMVEAKSRSEHAWEKAKRANDFSIFAPHLEKMIYYTRKCEEYVHPGKDVYDCLVGDYEEGMDVDTIDRVFTELKEGLVPLLKKILAAKQPDDSKFKGPFNTDAERKVQKYLLEYIGFSFENGSVGESEHPYTLNFSPKDVRVTNHFRTDNVIDPMFSAIHEGGHAIFEQNINPEYAHTVAGSVNYMGVHESQSRFFENVLGRNENFWKPIYADIQKLQPELANVSLEEFVREVNHVRNSFIRTEADEVTYCLHIILRFEMEKAIFRDNVPVNELPKLWNEKMQEYLMITPSNDAEGILQDMHWSDGSFGYFPSYLLGSIYDGMFLETLEEEMGSIDTILAEGRIKDITKWLNEKIHVYGATRLPKEVIASVCKKELSAKPILKYFTEKYTRIYNL